MVVEVTEKWMVIAYLQVIWLAGADKSLRKVNMQSIRIEVSEKSLLRSRWL